MYISITWDHLKIISFLIVVDAKSMCIEIRICGKSQSIASIIEMSADVFSTHGHPKPDTVSDNTTIFLREQFNLYCLKHRILHKFIEQGHSLSNDSHIE